jgi:methyl-accepting chemotaxis protein
VRLIVTTVASTFLAGILLAVAGLGFYRTMVSWYSSLTTDALSSATTLGETAIKVNAWNYMAEMGILVLLVAGWGLTLSMTTAYGLRAQIVSLQNRIRQIASGEADLTQRAYIVQFDEIGMLTDAINAMIAHLQGVALKVRTAADGISASSTMLTDSTFEAKKSVVDMRSSLDQVKAATAKQGEVIDTSNTTLTRLSSSIKKISAQVATQASYVEESSAAITEMAANITSVSKLTEQTNGITRSLTTVVEKGTEDVQEMEKSMDEITKASTAVNEIIAVISRISSQTNLLAMNAAIEAAHAGEAGRGFAVVADEVRNLAESSAQSAKQIMQVIKKMQAKIKAGVQLSEQVREAFKNITQGIASSASMMETIASSMSEQKAGANEVLTSVSSLIEATDGIKSCTVEQAESSRQMEGATSGIVEAVRQIGNALTEQIRGVAALTSIVEKVDAEANQNTRNMEELSQAVSGFILK